MSAATDDNILDAEIDDDFLLDDIEDLPAYTVLPTGAWLVTLDKGIEDKELKDSKGVVKKFFDVPLTVVECVEMSPEALSEGEAMPKAGDISNLLFDRKHKMGMGAFKEFFRPVAQQFHCKSVAELKAVVSGLQLMVVVKRTYNADKDRFNMRVKRVEVV